ncbi:aconitate hydratase AcnA [Candidatus Bandiella euplotis]|uniref:Aconitate hydratase n=1 Tax=Candidatus Bandiella euplotis TaxID=1664265 RepID=A0ABZ0UMK8_9RICK|nr:aconitate hydratase AcnA [Candidatus Bandiella woodruffii]WPX97376.1 Aconitate hydratase [Candidatus Bandiella woodruffii]
MDSFKVKSELIVRGNTYRFFSLKKATHSLGMDLTKIPNVIKILLENLLRNVDERNVAPNSIKNLLNYADEQEPSREILFYPARVLMQDFTGVPAIVDLAAMRDALKDAGKDPGQIKPLIPTDLVIDHSVQVDKFGSTDSYAQNIELEMQRNNERYQFLKWGQESFENFRVIPPGTGICHQVNLEYLADVVSSRDVNGCKTAFFDTLVGTDSHTTMINGLSVLGWGVGGIEAEACMLGQPVSLLIPKVVGFKLTGKLPQGVTATDLVLTITEILRKENVVGKFVEFYGPGVEALSLFERATVANMAPEYGATCGHFPIDQEVIRYLHLTGRDKLQIALVEAYAKEQGIWQDNLEQQVRYNEYLELDISSIKPCIAGPKRPQDRIELSELKQKVRDKEKHDKLQNGDIVISAITSCTNTSNPYVLIGAGLLAKKAYESGLRTKKWVKTSLAPGSKVVTQYLEKSGLMYYLEKLGFYLVGYGCTTCIGNSGPLLKEVEEEIKERGLSVASILSGNRNFEGRIHPLVKDNYLASPILCVAFALVGYIDFDILNEALGFDENGQGVYLKDIWPSNQEIKEVIDEVLNRETYIAKYRDILRGDKEWEGIRIDKTLCYSWQHESTYIKKPPFFKESEVSNSAIDSLKEARILAIFGDSVTTDHISPAGNISKNHSAGEYLIDKGVLPENFNSFGSRRGNDEVMVRGTFANIRIKNKIAGGKEGGYTKYYDQNNTGTLTTIHAAAVDYKKDGVPLVVFAGKEYGTGSSRDWAAKGTKLLGIKAVIAESFERIHRSNLVGMGVLPLQLVNTSLDTFELNGSESVTLLGYNKVRPKGAIKCIIERDKKSVYEIDLLVRIDTDMELEYFLNDGILSYVLKKFDV